MNVKIEESWRKRLQEEFDKPYFEQLVTFVKNDTEAHMCFLPDTRSSIFLMPVHSRK